MSISNNKLPRILAIDDQADNLQIIGLTLLNSHQYSVNFAQSGESALELMETISPDLILLDVMMPGVGGYELCQQLKRDPRFREIPVIFLSAKSEAADVVTGFEVGGADYITKPFEPTILLARVDTQIRARLAQLQEERLRDHMSLILNSMTEGLAVFDPDGIIYQINPKLEQLTGKRADELIERPYTSLFAASEQTSTLFTNQLLCHKSGKEIPVRVSGAPLKPADGEVAEGTLLVIQDIRELLSAESANQANRAKDEFLATISHELRTPLTTIIGNCELLADQTHNSENRQLIHSIEVAGRSQLTLVNNILDLSKIESGKFTIEALPYNLMKLLNEVEQIFTTQVKDAGIDLRIKLQSPLPFQLLGDDQRIRQILTNLIGNAIKFTQQGSVSVTIQREESLLCFRIQDSGVGIAAEDLKRLFDRFEQANSSISRRFGGSGLGLHISAQLAKQMGGSIAVESTLGEGSTFLLNLPYQESNLPTPARETSATHTRATALNEQLRGTVLVAEDTPELQLLERRILESIGVRVTIADNGKEALALATTEPFDLILMDMQMPVMDGIEATKKLRAIHNTTPIVALTANVMQKHRDAFFQAGGDDFLSKPINRTELKSILTRYLPHEEVT